MRILLLLTISLSFYQALAQNTFTVMSYNTLNYPLGDLADRDDTLGVILEYVEPDLLLLQELKTNTGLQTIVEQCNAVLDAEYQSATWVLQQSNPASTWKLQQNLIYNTDLFTLSAQNTIQTPVRDINEFILTLHDENWASGGQLSQIYVYVTHLKSSQGNENEELRALSAQVFADHLANLPSTAQVILGGDFNIYTSTEEAYQILLDPSNSIQLRDPIDMPGNWHDSSFSDKSILTQSTRTSQIYGDGAGGGMDDRFDFILLSDALMTGSGSMSYIFDSYDALGNNGTCYNQNITDCDQNPVVPYPILSALYHMSDHLPILMEMESSIPFSVDETAQNDRWVKFYGQWLKPIGQNRVDVRILSLDGKEVAFLPQVSNEIDLNALLPSGFYLISVANQSGNVITQKVVIQ